MSDDIAVNKFYTSPDISKKLDISESTLRKYSQILEKSGWRFTKNERQARVFNEQDLELLKMFIEIKEDLGMSLEKSSDMSVSYFQSKGELTHPTYQRSANDSNALSHREQHNFIQEFRHTKEYFENHFDKRLEKTYDGTDIVIDKLNQVLDDNERLKQAALDKERLEKENEQLKQQLKELQDNKSFFSKFFKQKKA